MSSVTVYSCPDCKGRNVQLCFPCWVPANNIGKRSEWELDSEAQPQKDSDKGYCADCGDTILVASHEVEPKRIVKVYHGPAPSSNPIGERTTLPTRWSVVLEGDARIRRVYVYSVSNNGTAFVKFNRDWWKLDSSVEPVAAGDTVSLWIVR
jgi:hypothetical protein